MQLKTILLIEDDADLNMLIKKRLEFANYKVYSAFNGYEGLYKYIKYKPNLIITDVMMPLLNGYEVCREIRREWHDDTTPIIILTAQCEDYDRIKGGVLGANKYLPKPFDSDVLLREIAELIT